MWGPHLLLTAPLGIVNVHTYTGLCWNSDQYLLSGTRKDHPVGCQAGWMGGWFASTAFLPPCWVYPIGELQKRRPWAGSCFNTWPSSSISFSFLGIVSLRGVYPDLDIEETGNFIYILRILCENLHQFPLPIFPPNSLVSFSFFSNLWTLTFKHTHKHMYRCTHAKLSHWPSLGHMCVCGLWLGG